MALCAVLIGVVFIFAAILQISLQCVIVAFPGHIHLLFLAGTWLIMPRISRDAVVGLQCVIMVFPHHTHYLILRFLVLRKSLEAYKNFVIEGMLNQMI